MAFLTNAKAFDFSAVCSSGQTLYYNIISTSAKTAELCGCESGASGNIVLPGLVNYDGDTYTVTRIGSHAFNWCDGLTGSLTIPSSVTSIGTLAFAGCNGFHGTLSLPSSLTSIGELAFYDCSGFTGSLELPASLTSIGKSAFYNCTGLTGNLVIPAGVTTINEHTFRGCVGFNGTLTLPAGLTSIKEYAFYDCTALQGDLTIPNTVTSIGLKAFKDCIGFTGSLTLSQALTSIDEEAFCGCSGLTGMLTIPAPMTTIETNAFKNCSGLNGELTFPPKITTIKQGAFSGCTAISSITVQSVTAPPTIFSNTFYGIPDDTPITVFCGLIDVYGNTSYWNRFTNISNEQYFFSPTAVSHDEGQGSVMILEQPSCENNCVFSVKAIPNEGYTFDKWTLLGNVNSIGDDIIYTDTIKEERTVEAFFKRKTASVIELSVFPDSAGTATATALPNFNFGNTITVTATPNEGYEFERWMENGETVSTEASFSFTSDGDRTLVARFHQAQSTITAEADPIEGATITGTGTYSFGETVTLTAIPNANYIFVCWKDEEDVFITNETTLAFTADIDRHFTALLYRTANVNEYQEPIDIFPNPTRGAFIITGADLQSIMIYNSIGQIVQSKEKIGTDSATIDLTGQPNGVYFARITGTKGIITKKIVKE